jgi:tetratricopeptide (TPR) repeat protein
LERQAALDEIARLEAHMGGDPSASAFPALAEANRRAGHAKEAERVAREGLRERPSLLAGRVALSLALLDLGRIDEARTELIRVLEANPHHAPAANALRRATLPEQGAMDELEETSELLSDLAEDELENAFQDAEAESDEMLSANRVVAAAVRGVDQNEPEGVIPFPADSPFATETVAGLLEQQNHRGEAQAVREVLEGPPASVTFAKDPGAALHDTMNRGAGVIATLERWLENLRRGSR